MMEFYNSNEMRSYPLRENCRQTELPTDVIVDLMTTVPASQSSVFVSSVVITPALVSVALATAAGGVFAVTIAQPVKAYRPYALAPLIPMASGHIVFGSGVSRPLRFTSTSQERSAVDSRTLHVIDSNVVMSIGRHLSPDELKLKGVVKLLAGDNVTIRFADGRLKIGLTDLNRMLFVGPCDRQAIADNCGGPPIRTINGVQPDSQGTITLEVNNG